MLLMDRLLAKTGSIYNNESMQKSATLMVPKVKKRHITKNNKP